MTLTDFEVLLNAVNNHHKKNAMTSATLRRLAGIDQPTLLRVLRSQGWVDAKGTPTLGGSSAGLSQVFESGSYQLFFSYRLAGRVINRVAHQEIPRLEKRHSRSKTTGAVRNLSVAPGG